MRFHSVGWAAEKGIRPVNVWRQQSSNVVRWKTSSGARPNLELSPEEQVG